MSKLTKNTGAISRRDFIGKTSLTVAGLALLKSRALASALESAGLKDLYKDDFLIGAAVGAYTLSRNDTQLLDIVKHDFNSITAENAFKWQPINPSEGKWNFEMPDRFVEFAKENNIYLQGHNLVWHSQVPRSIFVDESGKQVTREVLLKRMENHITTLVGRYKGRIPGWDVVNEAITPEGWRKSQWYNIIGPDFMERAFQLAHETDPKAHLVYNDYNMDDKQKREFVVNVIRDYKKRGVPINGIGMQAHIHLDSPPISEMEASIEAFGAEGMQVDLTELDVDVLPSRTRSANISDTEAYQKELNPYTDGLPKEVDDKLTKRYEDLFKMLLKHHDIVGRVTFWGVSDDLSWKNNFPVRGRTNYPLLFDRQRQPKNCYKAIAALKES